MPTEEDPEETPTDLSPDARCLLALVRELGDGGHSVRELSVGEIRLVLGPQAVMKEPPASSEGAPRGYAARATSDYLRSRSGSGRSDR